MCPHAHYERGTELTFGRDFKHSDKKKKKIGTVDRILGGGGRLLRPPPPGSATGLAHIHNEYTSDKLLFDHYYFISDKMVMVYIIISAC